MMWAVGFAVVAGYIVYKIVTRKRNLPPGPTGYPVVGVMFEMKHAWAGVKQFHEMSKKYGDVMSCYMGPTLMVMLNKYDAIKEAFLTSGDEFNDTNVPGATFVDFQDAIFTAPYNSEWKENKKFVVQALKNTGFGTPRAEGKIVNEIAELLKYFEELNGSAFEPKTELDYMTANALLSILLNTRYIRGSDELKRVITVTETFMSSLAGAHELAFINQFIPKLLMKVLFDKKVKECKLKSDPLKEFVREKIAEHRAAQDSYNTRDFVDAYIQEGKDKSIPDNVLTNTISIFFVDGIGTTSDAINWAIIHLAYHPEYQKRAQKQIDEVCGSRAPTLADRKQLTFIEAIMTETFRCGTPSPTTTGQRPLKDTTFRGYNIPKDNTIMFANLYACHMDEDLYEEPEKFKIERFINSDGKLVNIDKVIPFGIGPRMCAGAQYVRSLMFLTLSHILQRFTLQFPADQPNPTLEPDDFLINRPQPYKVCAIHR